MYLDFKEISKTPFIHILNWLNVPTEETNTSYKIHGDDPIVIDKKTNLFFHVHNRKQWGSIINFVAEQKGIQLKDAALLIKKTFIDKPPEPKREMPTLSLHYSPELRKMGFTEEECRELEFGLCKQKSIMAGYVTFRIYDGDGEIVVGHLGYKEGKWKYPNAYKNDYLFNYHRIEGEDCTLYPDPMKAAEAYKTDKKAVGMTSEHLTEGQINLLSRFTSVQIVHPKPDNIVSRLARVTWVKVK